MGVNIFQNSSIESNHKRGGSNPNFCALHGQGLATNQLSYGNPSQEANARESCKPQVDPGSHSAENVGTSIYTSRQVPEYSPDLIQTPSITSEVRSCKIMSTPTPVKSASASRRNAKWRLTCPLPPFPIYFSKSQYGMSGNVIIWHCYN